MLLIAPQARALTVIDLWPRDAVAWSCLRSPEAKATMQMQFIAMGN